MDVADFFSNATGQDRGRMLTILNPWTGEPTEITFLIAGPDGDVQRGARIAMMDELAELARPDGTVAADDRETARINCLARCVLGMSATEGGKAIPFEHKHVVRVLRGSKAIQEQVDAFAGDRANFAPSFSLLSADLGKVMWPKSGVAVSGDGVSVKLEGDE